MEMAKSVTILNGIKKDNPDLIYKYTYLNDSGELRFVFSDMKYNDYELDESGVIVKFDY